MKKTTLFFALLASLTISSGLQAQYRWHIIYPDRADTFYYGFVDISCSGENCSALGYVSSSPTGKRPFANLADSNFIIHSTDGGQTWNSIDTELPRLSYSDDEKRNILLLAIDQIDSLNAIAVGADNTIIHTFDGWKTWQFDSGFFIVKGADTDNAQFEYPDFVNAAEGTVYDLYNSYSLSTVDSGKHWVERFLGGQEQSYGNGMFRTILIPISQSYNNLVPDTMLTTHDDWNTVDTTLVPLNGPFLDTSKHTNFFLYGGGDTIAYTGYIWDTISDNHRSIFMAQSTDLGAHWSELPLPTNIKIDPGTYATTPIDAQTIVIAGKDSSEEIIMTTDRGATWQVDTVPLDNGKPYFVITAVGVSGSGRVFASIMTDSNFEGSTVFAYLEKVSSGVAPAVSTPANFTLYPNPATNILNIAPSSGTISISDPLGRSHAVPRNGTALDISTLPSGVYFISDGVSRAKFVKE